MWYNLYIQIIFFIYFFIWVQRYNQENRQFKLVVQDVFLGKKRMNVILDFGMVEVYFFSGFDFF